MFAAMRTSQSKWPEDFGGFNAMRGSLVFRPYVQAPNKALEPTTMAVTPRAFVRVIELKLQNPNRHTARGAPALVVAHL